MDYSFLKKHHNCIIGVMGVVTIIATTHYMLKK